MNFFHVVFHKEWDSLPSVSVTFVGFKLKEMEIAFKNSSATKYTHMNQSH